VLPELRELLEQLFFIAATDRLEPTRDEPEGGVRARRGAPVKRHKTASRRSGIPGRMTRAAPWDTTEYTSRPHA
jgi:hypothetical protein